MEVNKNDDSDREQTTTLRRDIGSLVVKSVATLSIGSLSTAMIIGGYDLLDSVYSDHATFEAELVMGIFSSGAILGGLATGGYALELLGHTIRQYYKVRRHFNEREQSKGTR